MNSFLPDVRNAVRAFILRENSVLLLRKTGGGRGERYALPGGAQDTGESLLDALQRECREEIGSEVEIGGLLGIADFFKLRDTNPASRRHVVEFVFRCEIAPEYEARNGYRPDKHQVEVVWKPMEDVPGLMLTPPYLSQVLIDRDTTTQALYLGCFDDQSFS